MTTMFQSGRVMLDIFEDVFQFCVLKFQFPNPTYYLCLYLQINPL